MKKLIVPVVVLGLTLSSAVVALADPAPGDGTQLPPHKSIGAVIGTLPFALGEVDLASLGVSDDELLSVGSDGADSSDADTDAAALSASGQKVVDDDFPGPTACKNASYSEIQAAVDDAGPGDKIKVCPGIYPEQVTIAGPGKDGLTLFSEKKFAAVIRAPALMIGQKAIVLVSDADNVTIRSFTITGPGGGGCDSIRWGVRVEMGGSATIRQNHITKIHDLPAPPVTFVVSGCQNGTAVDIGRANTATADFTTGSGVVRHNLIDEYQKGGILVQNTGSSAEVRENEVVGIGPTQDIAANGIQISNGAQATVRKNKVSKNVYSDPKDPLCETCDTEATGILLFGLSAGPGDVSIDHNDLFANEVGIDLFSVTGTDISHNRSRNNEADGIRAYDSTSANTIDHNNMSDNGTHDCHDDSGPPPPMPPANMWVKDKGDTQNRDGLCKKATTTP